MNSSQVAGAEPLVVLADHHREVRRAYLALLTRADEDNCAELVASYRMFEKQVRRHIDAEEELMLSAYETAAPADAATIRAEHIELVRQLERTGIDVELHAVRRSSLQNLIGRIDANAAHADRTLYPWVHLHLQDDARRGLLERFTTLMHELQPRSRE